MRAAVFQKVLYVLGVDTALLKTVARNIYTCLSEGCPEKSSQKAQGQEGAISELMAL